MKKKCPNCGNSFECRSDSILDCQCMYIHLTQEMIDYIADSYDSCLCFACLTDIKESFGKGITDLKKTTNSYK